MSLVLLAKISENIFSLRVPFRFCRVKINGSGLVKKKKELDYYNQAPKYRSLDVLVFINWRQSVRLTFPHDIVNDFKDIFSIGI